MVSFDWSDGRPRPPQYAESILGVLSKRMEEWWTRVKFRAARKVLARGTLEH